MIEFSDHKFMSVKDKELVLKAWTRFITNGFQAKDFTDRLYKHITLHCSFIAHYNRGQFYETYFINPGNIKKFLKQFDPSGPQLSVEYGMDYWLMDETAGDLNKAMSRVFQENKNAIMGPLDEQHKDFDLRAADALESHADLLRARHAE